MEELQKRSQSKDDIPVELIHNIQSLLPLKEAGRTCVLSKTWSHAWSTIPHLRFHRTSNFRNEEKERDYMMFMDHTISKYVQHNIPIESFDLILTDIKLASFAYKCLRIVTAQSCFKELSIRICDEFDGKLIPDEIFSGKNLHTLSLSDYCVGKMISVSRNPVIKCVCLRVLELEHVKISEEVLDTLFSTCTLLEKIHLSVGFYLKTFKIKNLRYLQELRLSRSVPFDDLRIDDVPNLCLFDYFVVCQPIKTFNMASFTSVTELSLNEVTIDVAFLDMINSKLPVLENLRLVISKSTMGRLGFTSFSLRKLTLTIYESRQIDIQVYAPKLYHLSYDGDTMPSLVFQSSNVHEYIKLKLHFWDAVGDSFFLRMKELLDVSIKFDIEIKYHIYKRLLNINIDDDLEIRFPIPYTNVEQLTLYPNSHVNSLQLQQLFIDRLFMICHPKYVTIHCFKMSDGSNLKFSRDLFKLVISGLMAKKTLTDSCITSSTILDTSDGHYYSLELKSIWYPLI